MARVRRGDRACLVDPLKMSQAIGAAMAFYGVDRAAPLLLGAEGCATVGLVFLVRQFQQPLALETVAVSEAEAIMGGSGGLEKALLSLCERSAPELVGLLSTGLNETRGDDVPAMLRAIRGRQARLRPDFAAMRTVCVATPDFTGACQDGWGAAVEGMVAALVRPGEPRCARQVNILAGCHLTPGDVEELREMVEDFGLDPIVLPDICARLGGGGAGPDAGPDAEPGRTGVADIRRMGASAFTLAVGEHMRPAAERLRDLAGVPFRVFDRLTGLCPCDEFVAALSDLSGEEAPAKLRRRRGQLVEAMLAAQPRFAGRRAVVALDPDPLHTFCAWLTEMGAVVQAAVSTAEAPILERVPTPEVILGDMEDIEAGARGADLLIAPSGAARLARRLGVPLLRAGLPVSDRMGAAQVVRIGYRGTRALVYETANLLRGDDDRGA